MIAKPPFVVFETALGDVYEHPSGWARLGTPFEAFEVTRLPLLDAKHGLFARLRYRSALVVAETLGASLMSTPELDYIQRIGFQLHPVIVRENAEEAHERTQRGGTDQLERMATIEWAQREDLGIVAQLGAWDQKLPVAGAGKSWVRGAAPGRALNYGWDTDPGPGIHYIQTLGTRHDASHVDYSQLTTLIRPLASRA
jgi:hypothetical protein